MRTLKIALILGILFALFFSREPAPTLKSIVSEFLAGTQGSYAVYIKNLKTEEHYELNPDRVFDPGSLYKLWVMAAVFGKLQKGELMEDQVLTQDIKVLNEKFKIGEKDAELTTGVISLTVKNALTQMITISHNYAALLLTEKIGASQLKVFLKKNGFVKSEVGDIRKTTATDAALFFDKLYRGEFLSKEASLEMLEILKKQKLNDGLPKLLPVGTQVAHKTGDVGKFKHDAGIVFAPQGDYIMVVLSESKSPIGAQERIAALSKVVYDYFAKE